MQVVKFAFFALLLNSYLFAGVDHKTHWNAKEYHFHSEEQFQVARKIVENLSLSGHEKVLDIGCGDGKITSMIQQKLPSGSIYGIDISESMIHFAKSLFSNVYFEVKDACDLDYDREFDLIVSFTVMHWITQQEIALSRMHKALKPGGKVVIEMPQALPLALQNALETVINTPQWKKHFQNYSPNWRFFEVDEYEKLLTNANFSIDLLQSRKIPHEFVSKNAFKGFLKQWFPYLSPLSNNKEKENFLEELVQKYIEFLSLDPKGKIPFSVRRLHVIAKAL